MVDMMADIIFMTEDKAKEKYPKSQSILQYNSIQTEFGLALYVMLNDKICALGFGFDRAGNVLDEAALLQKMQEKYWILKARTGYQIQKNNQLRDIKADIERFFNSKGKILPPILAIGTEKQVKGWQALYNLPYGCKDTTYGDLAEKMGRPANHAQTVGTNIVAKNSIALFIPCHRIIHKNGAQEYAYGARCKKALQKAEIY